MDLEEVANYSINNNTDDFDDEPYAASYNVGFYERLFLELYTVASITSFIACFILIFTILKYEKLRKQTTNIILLNMTILHSIYLFTSPIILRLLIDFDLLFRITLHLSCILNQIEAVLLLLIVYVIVLIICDWYLKTYHEQKFRKFTKIYKFFLLFIYFCGLTLCGTSFHRCNEFFLNLFTILILIFSYFGLLIIVIVINIVHKFKSKRLIDPKPNIGLGIANISVFVWLPTLISVLLSIYGIYSPIAFILATIIGFTSPILNIIYLYFVDNHFHIFLKRVITCKCNIYDNMQDQAVVFTETNGVQIT